MPPTAKKLAFQVKDFVTLAFYFSGVLGQSTDAVRLQIPSSLVGVLIKGC